MMTGTRLTSIERMAAAIPDGTLLAVAKDVSGAAMAVTRELVRAGVRGLHLLCVPTSGLQADVLIGAGAVATLETSAITLGEFGPGPRFVAALREGSISMRDATCPAVYAALQAGEKGLPFTPLRGLIGSDLLRVRPDWTVIDNPFEPGDPIALLPAIRPDVALLHAKLADRDGNVFIGRDRELMLIAHASRRTLVSVEAITDDNLLDDEARVGSVLPSMYVDEVALAPRGAWPLGCPDRYPIDEDALQRYATMARSPEGFAAWLQGWLGAQRAAA